MRSCYILKCEIGCTVYSAKTLKKGGYKFKGIVSVTSSDPPCKDCNALFTMVAVKPP